MITSERGATLTEEERYESIGTMASLLQGTPDEKRANELWGRYGAPEITTAEKLEIEEALSLLTEKRRRAGVGDTVFEKSTSGAEPSPAALERDPRSGLAVLQRQRVGNILRGFFRRASSVTHLKNSHELKRAYPDIEQSLEKIRKSVAPELWNQGIIPAIGFRLELSALEGDMLDVGQLKKNAFESVSALVDEWQGQGNLNEYLTKNNPIDPQTLWEARMKILFSSLKLAQKGARIEWKHERMTNQELELKLNQINQVVGEMRVSARRGGSYLNFHLPNHRVLTQKIVNELYKDHPEYGQKVLTDFEKYTQSPDSFLVSVELPHLSVSGEVLIAKVSDKPLTYTVEFLYVEKDQRIDYRLGTFLQNIALSLIPKGARIIATAHASNPYLKRHFERGAKQVGRNGDIIFLEYVGENDAQVA